jgi:hypothetical protein
MEFTHPPLCAWIWPQACGIAIGLTVGERKSEMWDDFVQMWVRDVFSLFLEGGNDIWRKLVQGKMLSLYKHSNFSNRLARRVTDWLVCKAPKCVLYPLQWGGRSVSSGISYFWDWVQVLPPKDYVALSSTFFICKMTVAFNCFIDILISW